ncbi:thyroid receptor-interacting protein 11 isoform X1 [Carcharodon carcharias]|uniref:thyroid receptor-interacting protein 11 isoform X1 n=1 Tax=Carcharodon carcharias TaxID=13397 RepID=UPI001B7E41E2|nr:thyroid receptor-interacting protein 11 isoform X1 [Carcharodon carcharias]
MSSWFGGIGSGLGHVGGSLSSLTGQLSSFTKDMLAEGAEEVQDAASELQVSNSRLKDVETAYSAQKSEYERLKKLYSDLEEKEAAAELQIKHLSSEYRNQLQQKEVTISHLKARQNSLQDQVQKLQSAAQSSQVGVTSSTASTAFLPVDMSRTSTFHGDTMDFGDVIWSQQEINRLSKEVSRLEADVAHWKALAQAPKGQGTVSSSQDDNYKLQKTIEEVKKQLSQEIDEHQHELSALQDIHRQKLTSLTLRHRIELAEYEERIEELEQQLQAGAGAVSSDHSTIPEERKTQLVARKQSGEELEKQVKTKNDELAVGLLQEWENASTEISQLKECERLQEEYENSQNCMMELQGTVEKQEKQSGKVALEEEVLQLRQAATDAELKRLDNTNEAKYNGKEDIRELKASLQLLNHEKEELQKEKEAIQEELSKLQTTQGNGNALLNLNRLTMEVSELKHNLSAKENNLTQVSRQKDTLVSELEELDKQNQEATEHLITLKDQLAQQRRDSEGTIKQLQSELEVVAADKALMAQELESQRDKLSQSAFALNELHMSKQQLEMKVKDLMEKLSKSNVHSSNLQAENINLSRTLQNAESQLSVAKVELTQAVQQAPSNRDQEELLQGKENEISELRQQVSETKLLSDELQTKLNDLKIQNKKLDAEKREASEALNEVKEQLKEAVTSKSEITKENATLMQALRMEKTQLESELNQAEKRINEEAKKYEHTINELTMARNLDATALQKEHDSLIKFNQEKDFKIEELKRNVQQLETDHEETREMLKSSLEGQQQLTDLLNEKETFVETLRKRSSELQQEIEKNAKVFRECESLKQNLEEKERQLSTMKEENNHLKEEMDHFRDQHSRLQPTAEPKTLDIIIELETEITELNSKKNSLEEEIRLHKRTVEEQKQNVLQLQRSIQAQGKEGDEAKTLHEEITSAYEKLISEKDKEIHSLQESIDQMRTQFQRELQVAPTDAPVILQETKVLTVNGENGNEKHDLSKVEIDRLVNGLKEKEMEIKVLNEKYLSLNKQLDQLPIFKDEVGRLTQIIQQKNLEIQTLHARVTPGSYMQVGADVAYLQQQLQAYANEREQMLAVLNEKTRENSQLKTEYHRMMDIIAAKEAALLKLQEENLKMVNKYENESQDMVRETIQNLSRIIREKDMEIDALTQKCQTLVTVLQTSGMGSGGESGLVSSNQFEELLQERDKLKQQVKKIEEWKQQVITTVQNMQHESAQLQDELLKLQGRLSTDGDCNSRLQIDYNCLIHSYEQKEKRLQTLSQELAEVQQSIGQLSSTKNLILDKLDGVPPEPQLVAKTTGVLHTPVSFSGCSSEEQLDQIKKLQQEVERLNKILEGKETTILELQNSTKLSSSLTIVAEMDKKEQEDAALQIKQMRERNDELHRSFREKDLLIKSKSDQLSSVTESLRNRDSENEVLKQAVTNLKERISFLEIDVHKAQEENDQIVAKSREKETEFRALQETNLQFSMMLREREFEKNSMREKASALEKLLKEKEEGKTGELNQLLNEVKSMQEQAGMFQHERDQVMLALKQKQMENSALVNELQHTRDKEQRLNQDLQRLRHHLIEMEESYTKEALAAEDREAELRKRANFLGEKLASSSCAVENASHQASLQVESLQEQLQTIAKQRDEAVMQLNMSQEQVKQYAMSLTNLQMVIEQFQQEEKAMYAAELEKYQKDIAEWKKKSSSLEKTVTELEQHLKEANDALDSASRLAEQLDLKEEQLEDLKKQVVAQQDMLDDAQKKLLNLVNNSEGRIDKVLMRNLFVGYFHTPKNKRNEAMRLLGSVLGLKKEEISQLLDSEHRGVTGWVTSWLGVKRVSGTQSFPSTPQRPNQHTVFNSSFSEMFVKFLEVESRPSLPALKLPVYDIHSVGVTSGSSQPSISFSGHSAGPPGEGSVKKSDSNPFLAPRSAAIPLITSTVSSGAGAPHLLMKPISSALPTFTPLPVSPDSSAGAVLKDLLKQ